MPVAALPVAIIALVALLALLAFTPLLRLVTALVAELPVVGGWIVQNSDAAITRAYARVAGWAAQAVGPLVAVLFMPFFYLDHFNRAAQGSVLQAMYALRRVVDQVIPRTYQAAVNFAWDVGQNANHYAEALSARAVSYSEELFNRATAFTRAIVAQVVSYAEELFNRATAYSRQLHVQALQNAEALTRQAEEYARALQGEAIRFAQGVGVRAQDYAGELTREAEEYARALQGEAIRFAQREGVRATEYARALAEQANALTLASVAAVVVRVARIEASKCQRFCNPLGDLGEDLSDLEGLFTAGALFVLAGAAARDPRGWAQDLVADLLEPAQEAAGAVLGEVGR